MDMQYATYAAQQAAALLGIDSPSGFTDRAAARRAGGFPLLRG